MRKLFQPGVAFMIVGALCFIAGALIVVKRLATDGGSMVVPVICMSNGALMFVMAKAIRNKNKAKQLPESEARE